MVEPSEKILWYQDLTSEENSYSFWCIYTYNSGKSVEITYYKVETNKKNLVYYTTVIEDINKDYERNRKQINNVIKQDELSEKGSHILIDAIFSYKLDKRRGLTK